MVNGNGFWSRLDAAEPGGLLACFAGLALILCTGLIRTLQEVRARGLRNWLHVTFPLNLDAWWLPVAVILIATVSAWVLVK